MEFNKSQEELLSKIRHDLKNTLSTIKMSTYFIGKKIKEKDLAEIEGHLKKIDEKVDELVRTIDSELKSK